MEIRPDQLQWTAERLQGDYRAFSDLPRRAYLSADGKRDVYQTLETSIARAQKMLGEIEREGAPSAEVRHWQRRLVVLTEMAAADLKAHGKS